MKNTILGLSVFIALCATSNAVRADETLIGLGVHGGLSLATQSNLPQITVDGATASSKSRTGLEAGVYAELPFLAILYFQPEFNYVQRGFYYDTGSNISETEHLDYFEVPLLLKAKLDLSFLRPFVYAGPGIALAVDRSISVSASGISASADASSSLNSFDFGIHVGAGAEIPVATLTSLTVDARYYLGLKDTTTSGKNYRNRALSILAGVKFEL